MIQKVTKHAALLGAVTLLATACGGTAASGSTPGGTIDGAVVKGPTSGATVTAYATRDATMGAPLGSATTDASGHFTVSIGDYAGPVMLQVTGGAYVDEATGTTMSIPAGTMMAAAIPSVPADATTSGIEVTPLTSMAHARVHAMSGGVTPENVTAANAAIGAYFSVGDILHTMPMNPLVPHSGTTATQAERNYGMALAAMSQYAKNIGMPDSAGIVTAMMDDAADGVMNGMMGTTTISMGGMGGMMMGTTMQPTAGTTGLATAMGDFVASGMNASGVTAADMQALMDKLNGSSGTVTGAGGGTTSGTMAGTVTMGPVSGATVIAYGVAGGMQGAQLGSATTDAAGQFMLSIGSYSGPVMIRAEGGSYLDDATGTTMTVGAGDVMSAGVPDVAAGATMTGLQVTPLTTMAAARAAAMAGAMTAANLGTANGAVGTYFSAGDILHTAPMDPLAAGSGAAATREQKDYGMTIAAMSQYASTVGMTASSGMVTLFSEDASDGVMNGMMGSTSISMSGMGGMMGGTMSSTAGTTGLSSAMSTFVGATRNVSGVTVTEMQPLIDALAASNGQLTGSGTTTTTTGGTPTGGTMPGGTTTGSGGGMGM